MPTLQEPAPTFYTKDQLLVQRELFEAIDIHFLPILQAIFNTVEWLWQSQPIPRKLIKALCLRDPLTARFTSVFCPHRMFDQSEHTIEHIQQHFGLRPFHCTAPNWYGFCPPSPVTAAESLLARRLSCVKTSSNITPASMLLPGMSRVPTTGTSEQPLSSGPPLMPYSGTHLSSNKLKNIDRHLHENCSIEDSE